MKGSEKMSTYNFTATVIIYANTEEEAFELVLEEDDVNWEIESIEE